VIDRKPKSHQKPRVANFEDYLANSKRLLPNTTRHKPCALHPNWQPDYITLTKKR
jgi:hypothetical protein